ncbi:hypothetical protein [Geminicoccus flavidas]|uniref:hypothetical protein n=1 Tax=Geminicoccus flavidas TaxID=2506407 RepID=UPI00135A75AC|nr:hypothetical protein [Geminicoccus flavidas]
MTNRSYECLTIRLADLVLALSRVGDPPRRLDEQPMLQGRSLPGAPLSAGSWLKLEACEVPACC